VKRLFYFEEHVRVKRESRRLRQFYLEILLTFDKSFSIASENQKIKDDLIRALTTKQFKDFVIFDFVIFDNKHCVLRLTFALVSFRIFLFLSNREITIVNNALSFATLIKRFFLVRSRKNHDILTQDLLTRTHFEHFKRENESFIAIQE